MDNIYFFTEEFIRANPHKFTKCDCGDPYCKLLIFNDNNTVAPKNIIPVDFVNKKKLELNI